MVVEFDVDRCAGGSVYRFKAIHGRLGTGRPVLNVIADILVVSAGLFAILIGEGNVVVCNVNKREYFFPGPSGNIISASSIPFNFRKIWLAAGLKRDGEIKPRPYDFRHHFACANIARWAKERKDVISMLPYLMRYMGHSSLEKTYYYVHLIPDYFADYAAATENLESLLPEVEPYEI